MIKQNSKKLIFGLSLLPLVWLAVWLSFNVTALGSQFRNQQSEMELDYAMGVLLWMVLACGVVTFGGDSRRMLFLAWAGKFFVVLIAMLFYEHHYGLDAVQYFDLKLTGEHWMYPSVDFRKDLVPVLKPSYETGTGTKLGPDADFSAVSATENTLRFVLMVASATGPYYHAMKVGFAFIGLLGTWLFYRAIVTALGRPYPPAFYLLAFFPSVIFWSSILGKDPLQFLFLGLYAYGGALWFVQGRLAGLGFVCAGLLGSYFLRPFVAVMAAAALIMATVFGRCRRWQVVSVLLLVLLIVLFGRGGFLAQLERLFRDPTLLLETLGSFSAGFATDVGSGGETLDTSSVEAIGGSLPWAIFSGFFRPLLFDMTNLFTALAAIENTVILLVAVTALRHVRWGYLRDPLVLWPALYSFFWASIFGFIVMANFGSGARYKLQTWPFLLMAILIFAHREGRALLASRVPHEQLNSNLEKLKSNSIH